MPKRPSGFTLIEILVVIVVIAILATLVAPNVFRHVDTAQDATARAQIEMLGAALDAYRLDNGRYPTAEQGLAALWEAPALEPRPRDWKGPYLRAEVPLDPWDNPYVYRSPGQETSLGFELLSYGSDGQPGGEDEAADIKSWERRRPMAPFAYEAVDTAGRRQRGVVEAPDAPTLTRTLEDRGLLVLEVAEAGADRAESPRWEWGRRREVLEVTRALAALLPAGMPLAAAIGAATHVASGTLAQTLHAVRERVERGDRLADALADHPRHFAPVYVGLVRAGERSGNLAGVFDRLTAQLEREDHLRGRLLSASIYPLVLGFLGAVSVVVLLVFVIPRFAQLLVDTGATLPRSTAVLLAVSHALVGWWWVVAGVTVGLGTVVSGALRTDRGRRGLTSLALKLPVVGPLIRHTLAARLARITGTLVSGGATVVNALDGAAASLNDPLAREEATRIRARVREGSALAQAVAEHNLFPPMLAQLIAVGEAASNLPEFLLKAAQIFEDKVERGMQRLVTLVEPAMIVVFGSVVAFVALSLLQAIYGINADAFR